MALVVAVQAALRACDLPLEERPFFAHITLARLKFPAPREVEEFLAQPLPSFPVFPVQEFILFQSRWTAAGVEHLPLMRFTLAAG
jgi:2'-5' RNA ligase